MLQYFARLLMVSVLAVSGMFAAKLQAAEAPLVSAPVQTGHRVELHTALGTTFDAYVAGPEDARRGVLIIHDRRGLGSHARNWAERFAGIGYRALAVDLYDGRYSDKPALAARIMTSIDQEAANANLKAGLAYLKAPGRTLATFGWDFGGGQALWAALQDPEAVAATVIYYGPMTTSLKTLRTLKSPVLGFFAKHDLWVSPLHVVAYQDAMREAGVPFSVINYDAAPGFADPASRAYNQPLANEVWQKTEAFLAERLN